MWAFVDTSSFSLQKNRVLRGPRIYVYALKFFCKSSDYPQLSARQLAYHQMSQFTNTYASSSYDVDLPDNLQPLLSDDLTPDLSISQRNFPCIASSVGDSDFIRLELPSPPVPSSLESVRPDRITIYVVYSKIMSDDYVQWWLQTDFGRKKRMRWDSRHSSDVWDHFDQVARASDGAPKVMCKHCKAILDHPGLGNGTSTMKKHTTSCSRKPKSQNIRQFMQAVS
jgi:hypothetical protein